MKKKCIIIPAYNEGGNIANVIQEIKKVTDVDLFIIDDGSKDHTKKMAKQAGAYVISHPFNMGYGVALQTGYKFALRNNYDILLQIDGDGQHIPDMIPEFFKKIESGECDVLIGSRFLGKGGYNPRLLKKIGIFLFKVIIRLINNARITDPTSGYQCMTKEVFRIFTDDSFPCDYPDTNIIVRLHRMGFIVKELPVTMRENPEGRSMHKGTLTLMYYFFTMFLSIFISLISSKNYYKKKALDI
ncbi:MAG: glycosyltransferase family 2 protein [Desulfobacteraceae bacterium]|nr:MAG: glycosyltransferase family 2 protein [Desulfobacteraceae bacterium]